MQHSSRHFVLSKCLEFDAYRLVNDGFISKGMGTPTFAAAPPKYFGALSLKLGVASKKLGVQEIALYLHAKFCGDRLTPCDVRLDVCLFVWRLWTRGSGKCRGGICGTKLLCKSVTKFKIYSTT